MSDATSMAEDFASGRSDPVQALEQALDHASRAAAVFITLTADRARREAEAAAARWRAGQPLSVFDGVPLAWKDLFDVAGSITTAGAAYRRDAPPPCSMRRAWACCAAPGWSAWARPTSASWPIPALA